MGNLFIIKAGATFPSLSGRRGDFEHWILSGMAVRENQVTIVDACNGAVLPTPAAGDGVVITGSHAMVTEHHPWSERIAKWLRKVVEQDVAVLGICFGHQLLAYALGGGVGDNPRGHEFGTADVYLHEDAGKDRLLGGFNSPIRVHLSHTQSVLRLPAGATCLGWNDRDPHQAFAVENRVWGVQFHPEYDAEIVRGYVAHVRKELCEEGQDPDWIIAQSEDTGYGREILMRFASLIGV
jgi:GMP synthase (glutamine-hydrolysing)